MYLRTHMHMFALQVLILLPCVELKDKCLLQAKHTLRTLELGIRQTALLVPLHQLAKLLPRCGLALHHVRPLTAGLRLSF